MPMFDLEHYQENFCDVKLDNYIYSRLLFAVTTEHCIIIIIDT